MRKTTRELSRLFSVEKQTNPAAVAALSLVAVAGDKNLKFTGAMTIGATTYEVAGDNGKKKVFQNVDDFMKFAAKAAEKGDGVYSVSVDTGTLLASSVPNDMKVWAGNQVITLGKTKNKQTAVVADIDSQLSLMVGWESGNAAQQAKKIEVTAQRVAVVTDIAALDTEIARLTVIANS